MHWHGSALRGLLFIHEAKTSTGSSGLVLVGGYSHEKEYPNTTGGFAKVHSRL